MLTADYDEYNARHNDNVFCLSCLSTAYDEHFIITVACNHLLVSNFCVRLPLSQQKIIASRKTRNFNLKINAFLSITRALCRVSFHYESCAAWGRVRLANCFNFNLGLVQALGATWSWTGKRKYRKNAEYYHNILEYVVFQIVVNCDEVMYSDSSALYFKTDFHLEFDERGVHYV